MQGFTFLSLLNSVRLFSATLHSIKFFSAIEQYLNIKIILSNGFSNLSMSNNNHLEGGKCVRFTHPTILEAD